MGLATRVTSGPHPALAGGVFHPPPQTESPAHTVMKRAADFEWLLSRDITWLPRWQELILNWVASWDSLSVVVAVSADEEHQAEFHVPTDLDLQRQELEELLDAPAGER